MDAETRKRAERLNEVYKHLFAFYGVKSKTDFADKLKMQRTGISAALNGSKSNLTDNLFKNICATYQGVFNLDYLLKGEGSLLLHPPEPAPAPTTVANDNLLELHAQMIRSVDDLRQQLRVEYKE